MQGGMDRRIGGPPDHSSELRDPIHEVESLEERAHTADQVSGRSNRHPVVVHASKVAGRPLPVSYPSRTAIWRNRG